jgi:energy-converting hydrogenase A subunit M
MQRIDENTYIDDTLVTCAEYQLFIDEMREQGKYYQPDHWTSHQFPKGQAKEPILGIRQSDAEVFCKWLKERENEEWKYRLPTQTETEIFPMKSFGIGSLGYWIIGVDQFVWVGTIPDGLLAITLDRALDLAKHIENDYDHISDLAIHLSKRLNGVSDYIDDLAKKLDHSQAVSLASAIKTARDRASDLAKTVARDHILDLTIASDLTDELARSLARVIAIEHDNTINLDSALKYIRSLNGTLARVFTYTRTSTAHIYFDLITLQERIAGRSPAFEGIRLVKERIR